MIFVSVVLVVWAVIMFSKDWKTKLSQIINTQDTTISGEASIQWTIIDKNNYPKYTHMIRTDKNQEIWIKSSNINLNNHVWKLVQIAGIYDTKNNNVINIDVLKLPQEKTIIKWNQYLFIDNGVIFDFWDQNEIKAVQTKEWDIKITITNEPITSFQRFSCRKILKWQTCDKLTQEYESKEKETFDSLEWYRFYKHADKYRLTFDNNFGYIFKDISDENILNLSNSFTIINEKFIIDNKLQQIEDNCKDAENSASEIVESKIQYGSDNTLISLIMETKTEQWKNAKCTMTFDIRNSWKITEKSFSMTN